MGGEERDEAHPRRPDMESHILYTNTYYYHILTHMGKPASIQPLRTPSPKLTFLKNYSILYMYLFASVYTCMSTMTMMWRN